MPKDRISRKEFEQPRSVADFVPWVKHARDVIASVAEGKRDIRFGRGIAKQLVEEAFPIGMFASRHYGDSAEVFIQPVLGNQPYDAIVRDAREAKSPISHIEVTQAHEGRDWHLRMRKLDEEGHVSLTGPVKKKGNKFEIRPEVRGCATALDCEKGRIRDAIERKLKKRDGTYPAETALVIAFDDHFMFDESVRSQGVRMIDSLSGLVESYLPQLTQFQWVALVGWCWNTFREWDNGVNARS